MGQLLVEGAEPGRNFDRARKMIADASVANCNLILLPETIDFGWTHPSGLKESKPIPGEFSEGFRQWAKEYNIYICVGLTENSGDQNFNTALLINPAGEIILKYRKINLLEVEFPFYGIGNQLKVVQTEFGNIGLNICSDNYSDALDLGRSLSRMGAQILLSPSSWTVDYSVTEKDDPYREKWKQPLMALSQFNGMAVISTTSVGYIVGGPYEGKKMIGRSLAVLGDEILAEGMINEFAGELKMIEFEVPASAGKGINTGKKLKKT